MKCELLFSVTKKDLVLEYFSGTGGGGQHRNKHQNSCRCKHPDSGAMGVCQDQRSKAQNTKMAFRRMVESEKFQKWLKMEACRATGQIAEVEKKVEMEMKNVKVEVKDEKGRWAAA